MKIIDSYKKGSVTTFKMEWTESQVEAANNKGFRNCREHGYTAYNKREAADFELYVASQNTIASPKISEQRFTVKKQNRYLTTLAIAERDGLNHGAAWVCSEHDIEYKGVHPSHEGEMICYVYKG
jgi:hypothetical protein